MKAANPRKLQRILRLRPTDLSVYTLLQESRAAQALLRPKRRRPELHWAPQAEPPDASTCVRCQEPQASGLVDRASRYLKEVRSSLADRPERFNALLAALQSGQPLENIVRVVRSLLAEAHPELCAGFLKLVGAQELPEEAPAGKRRLVGEDALHLARQSGLQRLNCVDHDMLCGLRVYLSCQQQPAALDLGMEQFAQLNQLDPSACLGVQLEPSDVFHASSYMPMDAAGMDADSEAEMSEGWIEDRDNLLLEQFADVRRADKSFMKLWNHFLRRHQHKMVFDEALREYLWLFVAEHRRLLVQQLRRPLIMHLFTCWEMGLISPSQIEAYLAHADAPSDAAGQPSANGT